LNPTIVRGKLRGEKPFFKASDFEILNFGRLQFPSLILSKSVKEFESKFPPKFEV